MKKYRVSFTIGDKIFLYNRVSSSGTYDHNWYKPTFTGFSLEVSEDDVSWKTLISYADNTTTYNRQTRYLAPTVFYDCAGDECTAYQGWVGSYNSAQNPSTDETTAVSIATFGSSGLDFFSKEITSGDNESDET